jgi:hypothetical protein
LTSTQAYESILHAACPPLCHRSEEAARRALECAEALRASCPGESFGWARRQKGERLLHDQLAILRRYEAPLTVPGEFIGAGGEHDVWFTDKGSHVFKLTNRSQFGYVVDQANDNRANKLMLRPALPSEYLLRLGTQNLVFGDSILLLGVLAAPEVPRVLTVQPYADQGRPAQEEIDSFMLQSGFVRVADDMMMSQFSTKPFWYRAHDSILTGDANPENFSRIDDETIVPIDIIAHPYPRELIASTAAQNGMPWPL